MTKRIQNKVAGSKLALPVTSAYAILVWLLCGGLREQWWLQLGGFALATFFIVLINNTNSLIRIYSRMVSCTFILLTCSACFLFPSTRGAIFMAAFAGFLFVLFQTYQEKESVGLTYYSYLLFGISSIAFVQVVYYLPLLWFLTATLLQSLSLRTVMSGILGLLTPYWFALCWFIWQGDITPLVDQYSSLVTIQKPFALEILGINQLAVIALACVMALTGIIHYLRKHHDDKIRVRLVLGFFIWTDLATLVFLAFQPQYFDSLIRIIMICTAPLMGHFLALTATKATNIAFFFFMGITLLLTAYNIWTYSSLF